MPQMSFFDLSDRYASLDAKKDPLVEINAVVPWKEFRRLLERVWRKPMDAVLMFKTLVLSALYTLSDDQIEYQVRDPLSGRGLPANPERGLSFMRFLGLGLGDRVPDAKTVWLYREALVQAGKVEEVFALFDGYLAPRGYIARGGQILDASIVPVPRNHNKCEENVAIKAGETPDGWAGKPAKRRQKVVDARWTKKHGKTHYGDKDHVNVDRTLKLIGRYHITPSRDIAAQCPAGQWMPPYTPLGVCGQTPAVHDSQAVDQLLTRGNTGSGVWADAAYRSAQIETALKAWKLTSHIHRKGKRVKPLTERAQNSNRTKSTVRVRVEHIFGAQANDMGGTIVRTIGLARAKAKIGMKNLNYNMLRLGQLGHLNPCPA
jgi:IS5 family transposase